MYSCVRELLKEMTTYLQCEYIYRTKLQVVARALASTGGKRIYTYVTHLPDGGLYPVAETDPLCVNINYHTSLIGFQGSVPISVGQEVHASLEILFRKSYVYFRINVFASQSLHIFMKVCQLFY